MRFTDWANSPSYTNLAWHGHWRAITSCYGEARTGWIINSTRVRSAERVRLSSPARWDQWQEHSDAASAGSLRKLIPGRSFVSTLLFLTGPTIDCAQIINAPEPLGVVFFCAGSDFSTCQGLHIPLRLFSLISFFISVFRGKGPVRVGSWWLITALGKKVREVSELWRYSFCTVFFSLFFLLFFRKGTRFQMQCDTCSVWGNGKFVAKKVWPFV